MLKFPPRLNDPTMRLTKRLKNVQEYVQTFARPHAVARPHNMHGKHVNQNQN